MRGATPIEAHVTGTRTTTLFDPETDLPTPDTPEAAGGRSPAV
jgi:hypothetical protein